MKKKMVIRILCVATVVAAVLIFCIARRNTQIWKGTDIGEIGKIEMYYPGGVCTVFAEEKGLKEMYGLLKSMRGRKTFPDDADGFLATIFVYDKNGEEIDDLVIRSDRIVTNDGSYICDRDYCDDFRRLYERYGNK